MIIAMIQQQEMGIVTRCYAFGRSRRNLFNRKAMK